MVRDVRGLGTLVPEDILWIQAEFDSQVSQHPEPSRAMR